MNIAVAHPTTEATAGLEGQRALVIGAEYGVGPAVVAALAAAGTELLVDAGEGGDRVFDAGGLGGNGRHSEAHSGSCKHTRKEPPSGVHP